MTDILTHAEIFREVIRTTLYSAITLYMLAILARWTAPFLSLNLHRPGLRWIPPIADPPIKLIRRFLPPMGFTDWSPVAALLVLYAIRVILVRE